MKINRMFPPLPTLHHHSFWPSSSLFFSFRPLGHDWKVLFYLITTFTCFGTWPDSVWTCFIPPMPRLLDLARLSRCQHLDSNFVFTCLGFGCQDEILIILTCNLGSWFTTQVNTSACQSYHTIPVLNCYAVLEAYRVSICQTGPHTECTNIVTKWYRYGVRR